MEGLDKVKALFQSRKFWVLVIALVAILAALSTGHIGTWEALQGAIAALAAYSTGVAIEDAGQKIGGGGQAPALPANDGPPTGGEPSPQETPSPQPSPWKGEGV